MGALQQLAADLGAEERTLRRAASQGTLRCHRPTPRRLRLIAGEREYLRDHWGLLAELRRALRTEPHVKLAVLYGSVARGDEDGSSDLDLLVSSDGDRPVGSSGLATRLQRATDRKVDIARLERVETDVPLLLDRVLDEGRVLVDRAGLWRELGGRRRAIRARAKRAYRRQLASARQAIAELSQ